jgi:hypothetical protein
MTSRQKALNTAREKGKKDFLRGVPFTTGNPYSITFIQKPYREQWIDGYKEAQTASGQKPD